MATNKQIEETGACAVKSALLRCNYLESFISENDKTPSWDGNVFVYTMENQKKENLMGKVPIQVKSTGSRKKADWEKFPCNVVDLRNYYNNGGCIFFRVGVKPKTGECKIYYNTLLVVDIAELLEKCENQKTITIKCKPLPVNDTNEMAHIFMSFIKDSRKQTSFIGKKNSFIRRNSTKRFVKEHII